MNKMFKLMFASAFLAASSLSHAVMIEFSPTDQTVDLGDSVSVDLIASDLASEDLGAFQFDMLFDDGILDLTSVTFGTGPSTDVGGFSPVQESSAGSGSVFLKELSTSLDLSAQADSFVLATLEFATDAVGIADLSFDNLIFSDLGGSALDFEAFTGTIEVVGSTNVPEPSSLAIMLLGTAGLFWSRRTLKS